VRVCAPHEDTQSVRDFSDHCLNYSSQTFAINKDSSDNLIFYETTFEWLQSYWHEYEKEGMIIENLKKWLNQR
jgi:hypothetical protein